VCGIVLYGHDEPFAIGVEAIDQRPASLDQALPAVHGRIGIASAFRGTRFLDPANRFSERFARSTAGGARSGVQDPPTRIQHGFDRGAVKLQAARRGAQPHARAEMRRNA
jgi:hypothetical protein